MNTPNKLTILRILLVPVFLILFWKGDALRIAATAVFALAAVTDCIDGRMARARGLVTDFGKIMDPLADKILVSAALISLVAAGELASWTVIVILAREFTISGMRIVAAGKGKILAAGLSGKVKTVLQMIAIILLLLRDWPLCLWIRFPFGAVVYYASLAATVYSGAEYIYRNKELFTA